MRAEASYRVGATAAAITDDAKALEIAPDYVTANRRMLAWATGRQQIQAALAIIRQESNLPLVRKALQILYKNGQRSFANLTVLANTIEGWAIWDAEDTLEISITDGNAEIREMVYSDAFHPFGEYGRAASFRVRLPSSNNPLFITLGIAGRVFHSARATGSDSAPKARVLRPRRAKSGTNQVTVIVPIYDDYKATRVCIETLLDELRACDHRAVLVEDATPDRRISRYLAGLTVEKRVEVVVNVCNLGSVGSVNRALERIKEGDVILLNSDTVVPRLFIKRLGEAARSSSDIGTVTPLSNNGEFCSFPGQIRPIRWARAASLIGSTRPRESQCRA